MFLDTEMAHQALCQELDLEQSREVSTSRTERFSLRLKIASLLAVTAVLGLLFFLPEVTAAKSTSLDLISESQSSGGLEIQGIDSKESQAAVKSMQKGFHALGDVFGSAFGSGNSKEKLSKGESSLEEAKGAMKKAETAMMNVMQELQSKSHTSPQNMQKLMQQSKVGTREWQQQQQANKAKLDATLAKFKNMKFPSHWKPLKKSVQNGFGSSGSNSFDLQTFGQGQFPQGR